MSPYCWTSHGCSALFVSVCLIVCVFLYVTCFPNCMSLCASPASLCVSWANSLSLYFESMRLLALLCVCLFVFVSLCVCVSLLVCVYISSLLLPCWSDCDAHGQSGQGYVCVSLCFRVFASVCFLSLCLWVFVFVCIYLPTCYSLLVVVVHMAGRAKAAGKSEQVIYPIRQDWEDTSHPLAPDLFNFNWTY